MKRNDLYEKVWSKPMTKLASELGVSDVGLAKACRRHDIPVPPRGYWAKRQAGKKTAQVSLPEPQRDEVVQFLIRDPQVVARQRAAKECRVTALNEQKALVDGLSELPFAADFVHAHPLVKATKRYCDRLPSIIEKFKSRKPGAWALGRGEQEWPPHERHGRYSLFAKGGLNITVSLDAMEWALLFHASVLRGLTAGGMSIVRRDSSEGRSARAEVKAGVEMHFKGEALEFLFSEGYKRVRLSAQELLERKKEAPWARELEMRPSGIFTFKILGQEFQANRTWSGTSEQLREKVGEIVQCAFQLASLQPRLRREREDEEEKSRIAAAHAARKRHQIDARGEQLKHAFLVMEEEARVARLHDFLGRLEQRASGLREPYGERLIVWIRVVRQELANRNPVDAMLRKSLEAPVWGTWPLAWWPEDRQSDDS